MVAKMCRRLHHAPRVAGWTDSTAFAGAGHKVVVPAVAAGKAVGEDAALQILLERFAHEGLGAVVVALAIELACAGEFIPGLVVLGYRLVAQCALGVARVVELGLEVLGINTGKYTVLWSDCSSAQSTKPRSVSRPGLLLCAALMSLA